MKKLNKLSFKKGFGQVKQRDLTSVRIELMNALGVSSRTSLFKYMNGHIEPKVGQADAVTKVFKKYGITEIWGE
jgi:hypothetical protein